MAWTFPTTKQAWYDNANFLDGISKLSISCWVRLDSMNTGTQQGILGHKGSTNYIYFQKTTNDEFHFYLTTAGISKQIYDTTADAVAATIYHLTVTWERGSATGLKIYRNGAQVGSAVDTTTQIVDYNSGGNIDLYLNGVSDNNRLGYSSLENVAIWTGYVLDAGEVAALYYLGWPHLAVSTAPAAYWRFDQELLTRVPDLSGNGRHIESGYFDSGVTAGGRLGKYEAPWRGLSGAYRTAAAGPPAPNPWTFFETVTKPVATSTVTGLSNGTAYEFSVIATDDSDNESTRSAVVEATPSTSGITYVHTPRRVWGGR